MNITLFSLNGDITGIFSESRRLGDDPKKEIDYAVSKCFSLMKDKNIDVSEICAIALGKRQFALEVLPASVLELTCDRSHVFAPPTEESPKKRRTLRK